MSALDKIKLTRAPLSGRIVLARIGKNPLVALEKRDATSEFFQTVVSYAFGGKMPEPGEGAEVSFGGGDEQFVMTVRRISAEPSDDR